MPAAPLHLPAPLETAVQRLMLVAREAAERTVESLGLAALSATHAFQRDGLLGAQFELNRRASQFAQHFKELYAQRLQRELALHLAAPASARAEPHRGPSQAPGAEPSQYPGFAGSDASFSAASRAAVPKSNWDSLHLVEDSEIEAQIAADRFGMDVAHACEWELREIDAYLCTLLPEVDGEPARNPLRPDLLGLAMIGAVQAVSENEDVRKVLSTELGRSMAGMLRGVYASIVADWRQAGLRPSGLSVRNRVAREGKRASADPKTDPSEEAQADPDDAHSGGRHHSAGTGGNGPSAGRTSGSAPGRFWPSERGSLGGHSGSRSVGTRQYTGAGELLGHIDPNLMSVIRRLSFRGSGQGPADFAGSSHLGGFENAPADFNPGSNLASRLHSAGRGVQGPGEAALNFTGFQREGAGPSDSLSDPAGFGVLPANLILQHREELRQASKGGVDHMVIDVIGFLFDQILADPKVAPQMARLLARLQLPVLRAALGDPGFFSSRRHPVRRFVNRIASLGAAFDDFSQPDAQAFLNRVKTLVQDVVDGDFEQVALYEQQLAALESFVADQSAEELRALSREAASVLAHKEDEQRLHQLYADRLAGELKDIAAPLFLRNFLSRVWSQVLLRAAQRDGGHGELSTRMRQVGRDLLLSVQPKGTPALRKAFLGELPKVMRTLTEGMDLVAWPAPQRQSFFGELMPAHAEALKSSGARPLESNLMARQVDSALARPLPTQEDLPQAQQTLQPPLPAADPVMPIDFSAEEAAQVGLMQESEVDWKGRLDIDLDQVNAEAEAEAQPAQIVVPGLPNLASGAESSAPRELAEQLEVGFAYKMHLEGGWHKVRLSHVSPGRSFFIFTWGAQQRRTLSVTYRMLVKLCESERLRKIETASLLERATARARRQLASLASGTTMNMVISQSRTAA